MVHFFTGGYLYVDDILKRKKFHMVVTIEDVQAIVETNDKKRFTMILDEESQRLKIRANQGHSLQVHTTSLRKFHSDPYFSFDFYLFIH